MVVMFCFLSVLVLNLLVAVVVLCFINTCILQAKSITVDSLFSLKRLSVFITNKMMYFDFRSINMKRRFVTLNQNLITALTR